MVGSDVNGHADDAGETAFVQHRIVQREERFGTIHAGDVDVEGGADVEPVIAVEERGDRIIDVVQGGGRQETEAAEVDTEHRHAVLSDHARAAQQRAVAAERDEHIEVFGFESATLGNVRSEPLLDEQLRTARLGRPAQIVDERAERLVARVTRDSNAANLAARHHAVSRTGLKPAVSNTSVCTSARARAAMPATSSPQSVSCSPRFACSMTRSGTPSTSTSKFG